MKMEIPDSNQKNVFQLKVILKELSQDGSELLTNWEALINNALSLANSLFHILFLSLAEKAELEELATQLWNKVVILKSKKCLSALSLTKARHVAFQVVTHLYESNNDEMTIKKHVIMALKTARAWIDCKEWENAEKVLYIFHQAIQKLQHISKEKKAFNLTTEAFKKEKYEIDTDIFQGLCLSAELKFAQSQLNEAKLMVAKAKEFMQGTFPNKAGFLSLLCHNFGVDSFKDKQFGEGVFWLKESYQLGKDADDVSTSTQASTLRLLANCYMEEKNTDWIENAFNAIHLANKIDPHSAGIYLKLQLNVLDEEPNLNLILASLQEMLHHKDSSIDLVLNALHLLKKHQISSVAFQLRLEILKKFEFHPDYGLLLVTMLDSFLTESDGEFAKTFSQECIIAHNTIGRLDGATLKRFHILFWSKAAEMFENENYSGSITWYNYSLSLYSSLSPSEPNLGKLHRNLATCYLLVGETAKASTAVELSEKCEPNNAHTQYISFKVALATNDWEKAIKSLNQLVNCSPKDDDTNNIICLAAHSALELLTLCPLNIGNYIQSNHCLLMSCAACLQIVKNEQDKSLVQDVLEEVLKNIEQYRQGEQRIEKYIWAQVSPNFILGVQTKSSQEEKLLHLYKFQALLKLNDARAETVIDSALLLPNSDPKLFHTFAAAALDPTVNNAKLGAKALKISIRLHLEASTPDYVKCSADLRNLIEFVMNRNEEEEALIYLEEAVGVIDKAKGLYPEIEIVWLMTRSWNYGLLQYNCCKYPEAEKWCCKSIKFLKYLSSAKENYEEQMITLYQDLLARATSGEE
uniref:Protein ZIP4 homolog n=1 Tax=Biomphalaria glabrata TaxID=6526 RepID=A0A2C9KXZ1_BIOGL